MIHFQAPITVRMRDGVRVNVSQAVSHAVEKDQPIQEIKKDIAELVSRGELKRSITQDDYEVVGKADSVSFWFIGGTSLTYRVGHEITQDDFNRIVSDLDSLEYRILKHDRKPSANKADKTVK